MNYLQKKKLAFMSIVNSVKGFVRTVTGVPPLTLPDCVDEDSVIDYSITGEGVGDRINLFSVNTPHQMGFISTDGIRIVPDTNYPNVYCFLIEVEPNTTYSYRRVVGNNFTYTLLNKNKGFLGIYGGKTTDTNVTFTTSTDTAYVYICGALTTFNNGAMYLNKGTHYIEEPYDKYIIPIVCNGKNLYESYQEPITTKIYLDEPLTEGETLTNPVKLPTFKGTTVYTVDTSVQPTNMSVTYYATSKE